MIRTTRALTDSKERARLLIGIFACCTATLVIAAQGIDRPGVYYDEVIQAEPAALFVRGDALPHQFPGATQIRIFDRWFPIMTQPYMGALKSQLLIPVFALFGAEVSGLRMTTVGWSLVGLCFLMLWARKELGLPVALVAGCLLAVDPNFLFISRHDWGSFALSFMFRCGGLYFVTSGWNAPPGDSWAWRRLFAGGLLLGLGIYNKIDLSIAIFWALLSLFVIRPRLLREIWYAARARSLAVALGLLIGAAPVFPSVGSVWELARTLLGRSRNSGDMAEKWNTFGSMLDGSYFHKLMLTGGRFEALFEAPGAENFFPALLAISSLFVGARLLQQSRRKKFDRTKAFVLISMVLISIGVLITPRAVRIHHALLTVPFPQLVVAIAAVDLWRHQEMGHPRVVRLIAVGVVAIALIGNLWVDAKTLQSIRQSGGKGRWSDAVAGLAQDLEGAVSVCLDWGLYLPLRFAERELESLEPVWNIQRQARLRQRWTFDGTTRHAYLVYSRDYALFDYGEEFLDVVRRLPPHLVSIRLYSDREGDDAFISVRFTKPHRIVYHEKFQIQFF